MDRKILILCFLSLLFGTSTFAEVPQDSAIKSFVNFIPNPENFQPEIRNLAHELASALSLPDTSKQEQQAKLLSLRSSATENLNKLPRGYRDEILFIRGLASERLGDSELAIDDFSESLKLRSSNAVAIYHRGALYQKNKRYQDAINDFREIDWRTRGSSFEALNALGECYQQLGDAKLAVRSWEKAYKLNKGYSPLLRQIIALRRTMIETAKTAEEKARYQDELYASTQQLNAAEPGDETTALTYAQMLIDRADNLVNRNNLKQAEKIARDIADKSKYKNSSAVRLLATSLIRQQKFPEAEQAITNGLKAKPNEGSLLSAKEQLQVERAVKEQTEASSSSSGAS